MNTRVLHPHPVAIAGYLSRALYLLVIPFARGLFLALRAGTLIAWAQGAWFDILVLMFIIGVAAIRWRLVEFWFDESGLYLKKGLCYSQTMFIPMQSISAMSVEYRLLLRPFQAVVLRADTPGGGTRRYDFELIVRSRDAQAALSVRMSACSGSRKAKRVYFPHSLHIAALAAFLSNSFAGVVFAATLLSRAGDVVGEKLQGRALSLLAELSQAVSAYTYGVPPLAAMLALLVLGGWFIGFLRNLLRLTRFRIARAGSLLTIHAGLVTRRLYSVNVDSVFYLDIRQSVMTRLLRIYLVFIRCTGYGKGKNEAAVLIPSATRRDLAATLGGLLPGIRPHTRTVGPTRGAWFRYLSPSVLRFAALFAAYWAAVTLLPAWRDVLRFVVLMACFPLGWLLLLKIVDYLTAGFSFEGGTLTLRYSRGFILHTVAVKPRHIALVQIKQSVFQRKSGSCDLIIHTYSEGKLFHKPHRVKSVPLHAALQALTL